MTENVSMPVLTALLFSLAALTFAIAPRVRSPEGFFSGFDHAGRPPGIWTLALSQVTTWIFARSLMNAAILGYLFGLAGVLAYTAYYGSFLSGAWIVDRLRFRHGARNIQSFLHERLGRAGSISYNLLVSLRLLTEVFANLLVVGLLFGAAGGGAWMLAIALVTGLTLAYSMAGGLHAALRTDVLQFALLAAAIAGLLWMLGWHPQFAPLELAGFEWALDNPGWLLLMVALLQVLSYPMHDPVMMDRGFLADRRTTRRSFLHAFWISAALILAFGLLGIFAGIHRAGGEELLETLTRLLGPAAALMLGAALVISAASTLDSTFSSAAKLAVVDMRLGQRSTRNGRVAMLVFALGGLFLVLVGTDDLFAAVAVSGTASLFLTPVIVYVIGLNRDIAPRAYVGNVIMALGGATLYFLEDSGYVGWIGALSGLEHSYAKLLLVTLCVLGWGMLTCGIDSRRRGATP